MKILFIVTQFPALSETFILNQILDLRKKGHLVHIYSHRIGKAEVIHEKVFREDLLKDVFYPSKIINSLSGKIKQRFQLFISSIPNRNKVSLIKTLFKKNKTNLSVYNVLSFINKPKYDVIHAHFGINGKLVVELRKLGLFANANFITTFHGYDLNIEFEKNNFYLNLFNECKFFTVNSYYSKQKLLALGCSVDKIHILPVGLNPEKFKSKPVIKKSKGIKLIFVGRLIKLKGPHLLIEICRILKERATINFNVNIIGDGILMEELHELISKYNLKNYIKLLGPLQQKDVLKEMSYSDIFILPGINDENLAEAQGLVIQEAQAMQLPVIISNAGGMKEGIIDGVTGYVVRENDLDEFASKIELLALDKDLRKTMGEKGRKFVMENYNIEDLNEKLIKIYFHK